MQEQHGRTRIPHDINGRGLIIPMQGLQYRSRQQRIADIAQRDEQEVAHCGQIVTESYRRTVEMIGAGQ